MDASLFNGLSLAYIGDAIYELMVRKNALEKGPMQVRDLHRFVTTFTNALAQAKSIHYYLEHNLLTESEINIFKRGRNSHIKTKRKNVDLTNYLDATGFEALLGYLYLKEEYGRLKELVSISLSIS